MGLDKMGGTQPKVLVLYQTAGASGNSAGTGTQTLGSYTVPANTLLNVGDRIVIEAWGSFTATSQNKQLGIKVAGSVLNGTGTTSTRTSGMARAIVAKTGSNTQSYMGYQTLGAGNDLLSVGTLALTDTATIAVIVESATAAGLSNDIIVRGMTVTLHKA